MTPLKAASRAYVNAGGNQSGRTAYDAFSDEDQLEADEAMRAALMALADCDLGRPHLLVEEAFKAILRSMCHADTEQAEKSVSPDKPALQTEDVREAYVHIVQNPNIMSGKPTFAGTRMTVDTVLSCLAEGYDETAILQDYPELTYGHIQAACKYALHFLPGATNNREE